MIDSTEQAIHELTGEQFIEWLHSYVPRQVQAWPELGLISAAQPRPEKVKKFILQEFLAAEAFLGGREGDPGFVRFAIANLSESDDPQAETALEILEKRRQQELEGHQIERGILYTLKRSLWVRLLKALGAMDDEIDKAETKSTTRNYIAELSEIYSTGEWPTAVGALAAGDLLVIEEYRALAIMLRALNLDDKVLEVLTQGSHADQHLLDKVVFDPETKQLVLDGVTRQLSARQEFLAHLCKYLEG